MGRLPGQSCAPARPGPAGRRGPAPVPHRRWANRRAPLLDHLPDEPGTSLASRSAHRDLAARDGPTSGPRSGSLVLPPRPGWRDLAGQFLAYPTPAASAPPTNPAPEPSMLGSVDRRPISLAPLLAPGGLPACHGVHRPPGPAEALPAVDSDSASPGLGYRGLLGHAPCRLDEDNCRSDAEAHLRLGSPPASPQESATTPPRAPRRTWPQTRSHRRWG
jgi:hypothetical protein